MFWADEIAQKTQQRFGGRPIVVRDEKTMSGYAHIGSMLSAGIHGIVSEVLANRGAKNTYYFEFNDMDAFDGVPVYLQGKGLEEHLGKSLRDVPAPEGSGNYAQYFARDYRGVIEGAGFVLQFDFSSEWYLSGKMDGVIREALSHAGDIRRIYKEVSGSEREGEWLPILIKCPTCGKVATTDAEDFDGETVTVHCRPEKLEYTKGCGFEGRVSPFGGKGKLPWKVEWAAKWKVRQVDIEGGGKDHATRGGAHDVASHISREVFNYEPPIFIPHEFFLVGGKKISSSKGLGSTARAIFELLPPKIFRLSLVGKGIHQQINFDPEGDSVPLLYDQYDKLAESYWKGVKDDYARLFEFIHPPLSRSFFAKLFGGGSHLPAARYLPRFSQVAFMVQMPHLKLEDEVARLKGSSLTAADRAELHERAAYAKRWLDAYAPEKYVFKLQDTLPEAAHSLSAVQKAALAALADYVEGERELAGERLHHRLHEIKEEQGLPPAEFFGALYTIFLNKKQGPQAGWFLASLPRDFVLKRLKEVAT